MSELWIKELVWQKPSAMKRQSRRPSLSLSNTANLRCYNMRAIATGLLESLSRKRTNCRGKAVLFISYNRKEFPLAEMIYNRLRLYDFAVYMDMLYNPPEVYTQDHGATIQEIKHNAVTGGYIVSIASERILIKYSDSRKELIKAIKDNRDAGQVVPSIIPFVSQDSIIGRIKNDVDLQPLLDCNIQSLERYDEERQYDEIVKRWALDITK